MKKFLGQLSNVHALKYMGRFSQNEVQNLYFIVSRNISKFSKERIELSRKIRELQKESIRLEKERKAAEEASMTPEEKKAKKVKFTPFEFLDALKEKEIPEEKRAKNSINMVVELNVRRDQHVRGIRKCPGGCSSTQSICLFTSSAFEEIGLKAGADFIATNQTVENIRNKIIEYDIYMCTLDVLPQVKLLGRILGPLNLMPSPKLGTAVAPDVLEEAVKGFKSGNREFRSNKQGYIHLSIGKYNYGEENILKNLLAFIRELEAKKPETIKNKFISKAWLSMGGVKGSYELDLTSIDSKSVNFFGKAISQEKKAMTA